MTLQMTPPTKPAFTAATSAPASAPPPAAAAGTSPSATSRHFGNTGGEVKAEPYGHRHTNIVAPGGTG